MKKSLEIGPAFLVTAAFVGPGTVITATLTGANYGFSLLWALLFSVIATIILQSMTARLAIVTQQGLGENIHELCQNRLLKVLAIGLVTSAIVIGNAAYQGGNISGASLGLVNLFGQTSEMNIWPSVIGVITFFILISGSYRFIERMLIGLVTIMSVSFIITFMLTKPDMGALFSGLFIPSIPDGAMLTVIALIGTTVVPYNLFLHAASVSKKWQSISDIPKAQKDLYLSIPLGGLISIAIVSTAASAFFGKNITFSSAVDIAPALQPLFGDFASVFIGIGLFAAGISSAVTAPLAAAFALTGVLKLNSQLNSLPFRLIWGAILFSGVVIASLGYKPVAIIWFAQVANGILLPVVAVFLLWLMNTKVLGAHRNTLRQNILGFMVVFVTLLLGGRSLLSAFAII